MRQFSVAVLRGTLALLLAGIFVMSNTRSVSAYEIHIVKPGETLSQIALRYGTTVAQLRQLNNLPNANFVWYGQRLVVSTGASVPVPTGNPAVNGARYYRVQPGDSLSGIAVSQGISLAQLAQMNGLSPIGWLYSGQILQLPGPPVVNAAPAPAVNPVGGNLRYYTVQPGDSITVLAQRYGISVARLVELNGLSATRWLYIGQVLRLPGAPAPVVQPNPPAPVVQPDRSQVVFHTVQPGEFLSQIAARYNVSPAVIARENGLASPNLIHVGNSLRIPPVGGTAVTSDVYHTHEPSEYPTLTERWIDVDLSEQRVVAYEGTEAVQAFIVSTGMEGTPTVTGTFRIWAKIVMQDMQGGNRAAGNYYHLKDVRNVQYFHTNYGFHGTFWHNNFGTPMSRGCINMTEEDAKWLFDWASPIVSGDDWFISNDANPGTLVLVHE